MCDQCDYRQAGYCGCYDTYLRQNDGAYEPLYECLHPDDDRE